MSDPSLKIRDYQAEDFEVLYRIDQICFPGGIAFSRRVLSRYLHQPQSITRIAVDGSGGILGFVLARIESTVHAHILTLDVVPEGRQQRIGTLLMNALHEELRKQGIHMAVLEVAAGNTAAQSLYRKLQYQYLTTIPGYYNGREDALRMARLIPLPQQKREPSDRK